LPGTSGASRSRGMNMQARMRNAVRFIVPPLQQDLSCVIPASRIGSDRAGLCRTDRSLIFSSINAAFDAEGTLPTAGFCRAFDEVRNVGGFGQQ
jgi:hypothetical protein